MEFRAHDEGRHALARQGAPSRALFAAAGRVPARRRRALLAVTTLLFVVAPLLRVTSAFADPTAADRETARGLLHDGDGKFEAQSYAEALKAYEAAHALMGVPSTGLAVARTRALLGLLVEARDMAVQVTRIAASANEPRAFTRARGDAEKLATDLASRIPTLQLTLDGGPSDGAAVQVTLDGEPLPTGAVGVARKANPGKHTVSAAADGFVTTSKDVVLAEGAAESLTLTLVPGAASSAAGAAPSRTSAPDYSPGPSADAPARRISPLVYIGFGVGAAGLVTGTVTGILHLTKTSAVKDKYCHGTSGCDEGYQEPLDAARPFATAANIGFGVGLAGVAVGVVGLFLSGGSTGEPAAQARAPRWVPEVGLGSVGLRHTF